MADRRRVMMIGAGAIAREHVAHTTATLPGVIEWHVSDVDPAAAARFQDEHPDVVVHHSPQAMLATPSRNDDLAVVCTPPAWHAEVAQQVLDSGRHVLVEKPLTTSVEEARELAGRAERAGHLLACCSNRFLREPAVQAAGSWLSHHRDELVRIRWIDRKNRHLSGIAYQPSSRWFLDQSISGGGIAMDWCPYDLAVLFHLLEPRRVTVRSATMYQAETALPFGDEVVYDVETAVAADLLLEDVSGRTVGVLLDRAAATNGSALKLFELEATTSAVEFHWYGPNAFVETGDDGGTFASWPRTLPPPDNNIHAQPIREALRAIDGEPATAITGWDAVFNLTVLRSLYDVARTGTATTIEREAAP